MKKIIKIILIISGVSWLLIFTLWLALSTVIVINRDEIGKYLILYVNNSQSGELEVEKILISPLIQFPHISVILKNVTYYEHKAIKRDQSEQPIATIENFYCGLEIIKLIKGKLEISNVNISNGELQIVIYPDSSVNLLNAVKSDSTNETKKLPESVKSVRKTDQLSVAIQNLSIDDLYLKVTNDPAKRESSIRINNFNCEFDYNGKQAKLNFVTSILIEKLKINDKNNITNQEINLEVTANLDKNKGLQVKDGKLEFDNTKFLFDGHFNPSDEGDLSLKIESDGSLNVFSLFANENVAKNLHRGEFYFNGSIEGKIFSEFPLINFDFGFKDVELTNPITKRTIKNLNLNGHFNSGKIKDLSEAVLKIDTLFANFPNGQIKLSGNLNNFAQPEFDINLFLDADVTGLDDIFKLTNVDSLKGRIVLNSHTKGNYNDSPKRMTNEINVANISFENFGIIIPGTIRFDNINGAISVNGDNWSLENLDIKSEATDFNINGEVDNIQYLIFDIEKEINANLAIKSNIFDLPNFLAFDPSIKRDFPHRILDLDLMVNAKTTTSKALHFKSFPEISFDIKRLKATAEGFLPTININSGIFKISESTLGFQMDFEKFKTVFLDGRFDIDGSYNSSSYQPFYIKSDIVMDGIKISEFIKENEDSVPEFYKGKMYGSLFLELQFADDSTQIKLLNLSNANLNYYYGKDTIQTKSLSFSSEGIDYKLEKNPNPLATLFAKGNFKANTIKTPVFKSANVDFNFLIKEGEYNIDTKKPKFFGANSKGFIKYTLKPFIENPDYHIYCNLSSFNIKEMMYTFLKDTLITGNLSLLVDISMRGNTGQEMLRTLNGTINLAGENLTFYGVDVDKLIEEFQRSQNFNLVDAGGILLAGPVGLVVTKGSDFAKILITNPGQSTHITQLVSNWNSKDGNLTLKDVAASTKKNRLAAKGWLNIATDSLNISFAVIDDNGCSIFTQDVFGDLNKPTLGKVKVVSTLLAPVTNLYKSVMDVDCPVFYKGSLPPFKGK